MAASFEFSFKTKVLSISVGHCFGKLKSNYKKAEQGRAGEAKVAKSLNFWMKKETLE